MRSLNLEGNSILAISTFCIAIFLILLFKFLDENKTGSNCYIQKNMICALNF